MNTRESRRVDTIEALAVAVVAFRNFDQRVERLSTANNSKLTIARHFTGTEPVTVTAEDHEEALRIRDSIAQRIVMMELSGQNVSNFLKDVNDLIHNETISPNMFGILAWAPKLNADITKNDNVREVILGLAHNSVFIGKEGHKVTFNFSPIDIKFIKNYNSWIHYGHDERGNLVYFWRSTKIDQPSKVSARVKAHKKDERYSNAIITVLNYVKVVE